MLYFPFKIKKRNNEKTKKVGYKNESCFRCWPYNIKSCIIYKVNAHFTGEQISVKLPLDENRVLANYSLGGKLWFCNTSSSAT